MKYLFWVILLFVFYSCWSQKDASLLDALEFRTRMKSTENAILLDVRTPQEYQEGFIAGAVNVNYNDTNFRSEIDTLDKSKAYFVYCLSGGRSAATKEYMRSVGFNSIYDLKGGLLSWGKNNLPIMTPDMLKPKEDKISMEEYLKMTSESSFVLVDFYAPWCAPCKQMEPMLKELKQEMQGKMALHRINIDENKKLAKELGIVELPVLKIFKNGKEVWVRRYLIEKEELKGVIAEYQKNRN